MRARLFFKQQQKPPVLNKAEKLAFLNPFFLFGLLAAGIPLLIHLWSRRRVVTIDFSSLMFLVAAHRQNVRRFQLKQLLILLLRMAIVALIALALARPFLTLGLPLAAVRAKTDLVIVLDNSYSMAYQDVDGIWFEKAKVLATDLLDSLRHGDTAALILMSDIAHPVFRQLTPDIESVTAAIRDAEVSYRATNVQPSLELAHEILADSQQLNKEIYLISDFAQNGWESWGRIPNASGARIFLLPVFSQEPGGREAPALHDVAENHRKISSEKSRHTFPNKQNTHNTNIEEIYPSNQLIGVNLPFQLNVTTTNHSAAPLEQNVLTLFIGEQKRKTMSFSASANETLSTTLTHNFSTPGTHTGYLTLTPDRLNVDNRRYFALEVLGEVRVLCVGEQTEYLMLALNPTAETTGTGREGSKRMILPTQCTPTEFETFPLEDYDVIIFADVPQVSRQIGMQLREFIRHGKSIIVFARSDSDTNSYNQLSDVLPAQLGAAQAWQTPQQIHFEESRKALHQKPPTRATSNFKRQQGMPVLNLTKTHPIFDIFPIEGFSAHYAPQFYNGLTLLPAPESNVIAHFSDGTPFLLERSQGRSTILLYNCGLQVHKASETSDEIFKQLQTTAETTRAELYENPCFLPLLQQSVLYTVKAGEKSWHIGETYMARYPRSAGAKASIKRKPDAPDSDLRVSVRAHPDTSIADTTTVVPIAEDGTLRFQGTEHPGIYQVEVRTQGRLQRDVFAVNVDAAEADLAQIPLQKAASQVGAVLVETTAAEGTDGESAAADAYNVKRHGREIWGELLILVVCLMLLESFLSNRERAAERG